MTGKDIPDGDNVVRYIGGSFIEDGRVTGDAFCLTSGRDRLSVNWLEYFAGLEKPEQISEIRKLPRLKMGVNGRLAEFNVGATKERLQDKLPGLRFVNSPLDATEIHPADPSHGDIIGLPQDDSAESNLIRDRIAECVTEMHPAREG